MSWNLRRGNYGVENWIRGIWGMENHWRLEWIGGVICGDVFWMGKRKVGWPVVVHIMKIGNWIITLICTLCERITEKNTRTGYRSMFVRPIQSKPWIIKATNTCTFESFGGMFNKFSNEDFMERLAFS